MVELRTERLRLRPARADDLMAVHAVLSDPRATAFWSTLPHRDLDQSKEWLDSMLAIAADEGEDFIVEHEGQAIGKAGFHRFPEIGFILHPDQWGRGLAREALSAAIGRGFAVHRLDRIEADVDPRNQASLRLLTRLGFIERERKARTWQIGDQWCDSVYLHLDASAWAAGRSESGP
jgi:[ribosomal protein S5]-alanine N-acetyltransferase